MQNKKERKTVSICGIPLNKENIFNFLLIVSIITAVFIIIESVRPALENNSWAKASFGFLALCASLYYLCISDEKTNKDREIANLKQEIKKLENFIKYDKTTIELLEKELEMERAKKQQY